MPITALPTPPSRADSANFAVRADAFFAALPTFVTQFNALVPSAVAGAVTGSLTVTGDVGIGTATPNYRLDVYSPAVTTVAKFTTGATDILTRYANSGGERGYIGTGVSVFAGASSADLCVSSFAGALRLGSANIERVTVDASGYMLVGYTTSNGAYKLQVNSQIFATSSTVATSDGRYKRNITTLTGALALVNALRPVSFAWKPHAVHRFQEGRQIGFIAQEVLAALDGTDYSDAVVKKNSTVLPDGTDESFLGIAEGNLIAVLTAAVQELTARVAALEAAAP